MIPLGPQQSFCLARQIYLFRKRVDRRVRRVVDRKLPIITIELMFAGINIFFAPLNMISLLQIAVIQKELVRN
jgi:hypothetical protein